MKDYIKPIIQDSLNHFILHASAKDILSERGAKDMEKLILDLAISVKFQSREAWIHSLTIRKNKHLSKIQEVNDLPREIRINLN